MKETWENATLFNFEGGRVLPKNGLYGRLCQKGVPFLGVLQIQVYESIGNLSFRHGVNRNCINDTCFLVDSFSSIAHWLHSKGLEKGCSALKKGLTFFPQHVYERDTFSVKVVYKRVMDGAEPPCSKLCRGSPLELSFLTKATYQSFTSVGYLFKCGHTKSFENGNPWQDKKNMFTY